MNNIKRIRKTIHPFKCSPYHNHAISFFVNENISLEKDPLTERALTEAAKSHASIKKHRRIKRIKKIIFICVETYINIYFFGIPNKQ